LTDYFLSEDEKYKEEINEQNPLGTKGKLVNAYAELLRDMWSGQSSSVRPFKLKVLIFVQIHKHKYIITSLACDWQISFPLQWLYPTRFTGTYRLFVGWIARRSE
jgi:hypothetical protein